MTCVLAIESNKLDQMVVVDESILTAYGSGIYIQIGEELTLKDLLYGLMLRSGNDAAVMIASYVAGSEEKFVELMNEKAKELGMENTVFSNSSGLDNTDNGNYSCAYDMALLTRYAMQYPEYREIVSTKKYTLKTNFKSYIWTNKNKLLLQEDYITGGKTGYTEKARRTLVTTGSKDKMDFIVVTLRDSDDWNTHRDLYEYAFRNYEAYKVMNKESFEIIGDSYYEGNFYIKNDVYIPLKKGETGDLVSYTKLLKLDNYKSDDCVGYREIYLGEEFLYRENVYIDVEKSVVTKKSFWQRLWERVRS